ncbi:MAG TPA: hypothetical protein VFB93_18865 [Burkholderiales bacterium]|nr:hypothetical protein [Burkholderiales bacterium]
MPYSRPDDELPERRDPQAIDSHRARDRDDRHCRCGSRRAVLAQISDFGSMEEKAFLLSVTIIGLIGLVAILGRFFGWL